MEAKVSVGLIGCGNISGAYIKGCRAFHILDVVACADLDVSRAQAKAEEYGGIRACTVGELLGDPEIQIAVNLTVPTAHAEVSLAAIEAGKHVHSEKPLAINRADGHRILSSARENEVLVGCAPDTFLGGGLQTSRKLIDDGWIGEPVAATAFMTGHGPESWHPQPHSFYRVGAGPMFDMGPYYLTALVSLLGPVARVTARTRISFPHRLITSQPHFGQEIDVQVPTHVAGVLDFDSGVLGTIITSFDVWAANLPRIEVYGSEGSISVPDPNLFGGPVRVWRAEVGEWKDIPLTHRDDVRRGIGVADMAYALSYGRSHRANGELAYHVLDIMQAFDETASAGSHVAITSRCQRPVPLPLGLRRGELDA